ncbi:hypothetical protein YB2330_006536 [Saitoella coloradoensis]
MAPPPAKKLGTLIVVVMKGKNLPNRVKLGKQDPYCICRIAHDAKKTNTHKRGGQNPEWDHELRFEIMDSADHRSMKLSVFNDDSKSPDLVGDTVVDLKETLRKGEFDDWVELKYKERYAGEIYLEMTFYSAAPPPIPPQPPALGPSSSPSRPKRRPLPQQPGGIPETGAVPLHPSASAPVVPIAHHRRRTPAPAQTAPPPLRHYATEPPVDARGGLQPQLLHQHSAPAPQQQYGDEQYYPDYEPAPYPEEMYTPQQPSSTRRHHRPSDISVNGSVGGGMLPEISVPPSGGGYARRPHTPLSAPPAHVAPTTRYSGLHQPQAVYAAAADEFPLSVPAQPEVVYSAPPGIVGYEIPVRRVSPSYAPPGRGSYDVPGYHSRGSSGRNSIAAAATEPAVVEYGAPPQFYEAQQGRRGSGGGGSVLSPPVSVQEYPRQPSPLRMQQQPAPLQMMDQQQAYLDLPSPPAVSAGFVPFNPATYDEYVPPTTLTSSDPHGQLHGSTAPSSYDLYPQEDSPVRQFLPQDHYVQPSHQQQQPAYSSHHDGYGYDEASVPPPHDQPVDYEYEYERHERRSSDRIPPSSYAPSPAEMRQQHHRLPAVPPLPPKIPMGMSRDEWYATEGGQYAEHHDYGYAHEQKAYDPHAGYAEGYDQDAYGHGAGHGIEGGWERDLRGSLGGGSDDPYATAARVGSGYSQGSHARRSGYGIDGRPLRR